MHLAESLVGLSIFQTLLLNVCVSSYIPSSFFCSLTSFKFLQITTYPTGIQIVLVNDDDIKHYIWEFSIKECGAYSDLAESRFLWPFGCNLFGAFTTFNFSQKDTKLAVRESKTKAKLRRLSSTRAVWSASYSRGVNSPAAPPSPESQPSPSLKRDTKFQVCCGPAKWIVSRSPESQPSRTRDAAGYIGRPAGQSGSCRATQESAERAGGQPGGGILGGAGSDARKTEKPGFSSGCPLGPPCDFETGAPDRSLETVTPPASSRGRQRLRHRAFWRSLTLLAVCRATGGAVGTWMTAGWATCVAADALVGLCLRREGVTQVFFFFFIPSKRKKK